MHFHTRPTGAHDGTSRHLILLALFLCLSLAIGQTTVWGQCATPSGPAAAGLSVVQMGPVDVHAGSSLLDIEDCSGDGNFDAAIPSSSSTSPATFDFSRVCDGLGPYRVRIVFIDNGTGTTFRAYDASSTLLNVRSYPAPKPAVVQVAMLAGFGTRIHHVTVEGAELCILRVCWRCNKIQFLRGDVTGDENVAIDDAVNLLNHLFLGTEGPVCEDAADANDDGTLDMADPLGILGSLFLGRGKLPGGGVPAADETEDRLDCSDPDEDATLGEEVGKPVQLPPEEQNTPHGTSPIEDPTGPALQDAPPPVPAHLPRRVRDVANRFLAEHVELARVEGNWLGELGFGTVYPVYSPLQELPAYFEIQVLEDDQPAGALMVSVEKNDYPVASFKTEGSPLAEILLAQVAAIGSPDESVRLVRYGVGYLAAEGEQGNLLDSLGTMPAKLAGGQSAAEFEVEVTEDGFVSEPQVDSLIMEAYGSYEEMRDAYPGDYAEAIQWRAEEARADWDLVLAARGDGQGSGSWSYSFAGKWDDQRYYSQIPPGDSPNSSSCYSGCGATAWTMLYGWLENEEGLSKLIPNAASQCDTTDTDNVQWVLRQQDLDTFCLGDGGATYATDMFYGYGWGERKGYGYTVYGKYCAQGCEKAWKYPRNAIKAWGVPAIVGFDSHYALAYGYAVSGSSNRWFRCNMGWADRDDCSATREWIKASTLWLGIQAEFH